MSVMKKLPVFVFPVTLEFYLAAKHTYKQLLTLYNPYDFVITFKVMCTSPTKFSVIDPEGIINPRSCMDIIVRYRQPINAHCNTIDKFRILMQDRGSSKLLGKREIPVKFLPGEPGDALVPEDNSETFQPLINRGLTTTLADSPLMCGQPANKHGQTNLIAVAVGLCCIAALILPTQFESHSESPLPVYLHLSVHLKLVFAFVLGLVSMVVLKPH